MAVDMYHHNAIAEALRRTVRGIAPLVAEVSEGTSVEVLCGRMFASGMRVKLIDEAGQSESHVVAEVVGDEVRLVEEIEHEFTTAAGARLQLNEGVPAALKWVAQGRPELAPTPRWGQLPAIIIEPGTMSQPENAGSNRTYQQEYRFKVYYARQAAEGEQAQVEMLGEVGEIFNLIMSDPYLGGTCWHAQVTGVDTRPREEEELRGKAAVSVARIEVLAERSEVWG
ncbi:MAG: hypothetical protein ACYC63_16860 [Armatimonadota bacterium]